MKKTLAFLILLLFVPAILGAATKYVTSAGAGLKNGTSWANAYDPNVTFKRGAANLTNGDTYIFAGGSYASSDASYKTFFAIGAGSQESHRITIRKASAAECLEENAPAGCTDQAVFSQGFMVNGSYITIDGVTGTANTKNTYGFSIYCDTENNTGMAGVYSDDVPKTHIIYDHIYFEGNTPNLPHNGVKLLSANPASANDSITIQNSAFHYVMRPIITNLSTNIVIDNVWFERNTLYSHGDSIFNDNGAGTLYDVTQNNIVRNSTFKDMSGTNVIALCMGGTCRGWQIYNNLFWHDSTWAGVPNELIFRARTGAFAPGQTVTGGTSSATCEIASIVYRSDNTAGVITCVGATTGFSYTTEDLLVGETKYATTQTADNANIFQANAVIGNNTSIGSVIGAKIQNNTVYNYGTGGNIHINGSDATNGTNSQGNDVSNNLFYTLTSFNLDLHASDSTTVVNNNAYGAVTTNNWTLNSRGTNEIALDADPFTNKAADPPDLTLAAGGDAIGAGLNLSATFTTDKNGVTRTVPWDIGAYKYGTGTTTWDVATSATNCTVSPSSATAADGATTAFTMTGAYGYSASGSGCGGTLSGGTYTTGAVTAACTGAGAVTCTGQPHRATIGSGGSVTLGGSGVATLGN